jgi:hypothetical protein
MTKYFKESNWYIKKDTDLYDRLRENNKITIDCDYLDKTPYIGSIVFKAYYYTGNHGVIHLLLTNDSRRMLLKMKGNSR